MPDLHGFPGEVISDEFQESLSKVTLETYQKGPDTTVFVHLILQQQRCWMYCSFNL